MKNKYSSKFDSYVCVGDSIEAEFNGFTFRALIAFDEEYNIDDDDCHSEDQAVTGCDNIQHKKNMNARKAWFNGEWFYGVLSVSVSRNGILLDEYAASLGGLECNYPGGNNDYLTEEANNLLEEAEQKGREILDTLQY